MFDKLIWQAKNNLNIGRCMLCGKEIAGTCNSHSIPEAILRNISSKGWVLKTEARQYLNTLWIWVRTGSIV